MDARFGLIAVSFFAKDLFLLPIDDMPNSSGVI